MLKSRSQGGSLEPRGPLWSPFLTSRVPTLLQDAGPAASRPMKAWHSRQDTLLSTRSPIRTVNQDTWEDFSHRVILSLYLGLRNRY